MIDPLGSAEAAEEKPSMPVIGKFRKQMRRRLRTMLL
jgi:hypothetical protein